MFRFYKIKDSITLGAFGGLLGGIAMSLSSAFLWKKGVTELLYGHFGGSVFMNSLRINQRKNYILGEILHLVTATGIGIPIVYIFKKTGKDNHLLKGSLMGFFAWGFLHNFGKRAGFYGAKPRLTKSLYSALFNNILYGLVTSQVIVWAAEPGMFPDSRKQVNRDKKEQIVPQKDIYVKTEALLEAEEGYAFDQNERQNIGSRDNEDYADYGDKNPSSIH